ncbi:hypothetical protein JD844_028186 [Phrynosoma platyrhinos]|uniref:Uncharacterized protein n=1 Tax=Phrynosoma platyrhinos TaxID=52577 RepID=A0ABQ7SHN7_PHRPL|nr:hypothetical protein JD844_028186 [Phrynosoma platyrhinos]
MTPLDKDPNGLDNPTFVIDDGEHYCSFHQVGATVPDREERHKRHVKDGNRLAYTVTDIPPWYLCIFLGIQVDKTIKLLQFE